MNRRGFFGLLAGIAATAFLDPEKLLWKPGARLISIPNPPRVIVRRYLLDGEIFPTDGYDYKAFVEFEAPVTGITMGEVFGEFATRIFPPRPFPDDIVVSFRSLDR